MQQQSSSQPTSTPNRNLFEDPAIQQAARDDVFVRFMSKHWVSTLSTLVAVALVMIAYNIFTTTADKKRAQATALLRDVQESYNALVEEQVEFQGLERSRAKAASENEKKELGAKVDESSKEVARLREKVSLMVSSLKSPEPFGSLAELYRGLVAGRFKEYDTVRSILAAHPWEQAGKEGSSERFIGEVATLGLAKSLAESEKDIAVAKDALRGLAERGDFVAVEAVATLSLLATTPEEKTRTKGLIADLKNRFPAQARYLSELSERL